MESIDYKALLDISQSTATVRTRDELQAFIDGKVKPRFDFNNRWDIRVYNSDLNTLESLFTNKITGENSESVSAFFPAVSSRRHFQDGHRNKRNRSPR
jgi:hypothetical protein